MNQAGFKAAAAVLIAALMAVSAAAQATVTIDGKQFPVCQDASKAGSPDAFGRRWGWENNQSCVVIASTTVIDGKTYPLFKCDTTSESHPFFTGAQQRVIETGRIEKFRQKFGNRTGKVA